MLKQAVYSNKYVEVFCHPEQKLFELYWQIATEEMSDDEYRDTTLELTSFIAQKAQEGVYRAEKYLLDNRFFMYEIPQETQIWQRDKIFRPLIAIGGKKIAVVMSDGYRSQHLIEQTFQESQEANLITQYFSDLEKAKAWLFSTKELQQD
ncbi:hypothetical protein BKI52_42880 [marine bacterium AO1-C]|nr:hypothetical protein BKI52_42880 [marine bacterium AO1-C]